MKTVFFACVAALCFSCGEATIPKPYGYFRVALPEHSYHPLDTLNLPYTFEMPDYAAVMHSHERDSNSRENPYWIDIEYRWLNATIFCSYKRLENNLYETSEEAREIVYKHSVRADGIGEKFYDNSEYQVFGILYNLDGNTASVTQFVLTDSVRHFFRAAVYFNSIPNPDSIAPMAEFVNEDIVHIMETFRWKR